jgi:hypothetical protein
MKARLLSFLMPILSIIFLLMLTQPLSVQAETGRVLIVVNSTLSSNITPSINQYVADLEFEGYTTEIVTYDASAPTASPQDLRGLIQSYYNQPESLVGCVMIGELPVAYYEHLEKDFWGEWYWEFSPTDRYYMDMNGTWFDINPEDGAFERAPWGPCQADPWCEIRPEIWVGRIPSSYIYGFLGFETEADCVQNYFVKNHHYRTSQLSAINYGALLFSDPAYEGELFCNEPYPTMMYYFGYDADNLTKECSDTTQWRYLYELRVGGREHVALFAHGGENEHFLGSGSEILYSSELRNKRINTLFHTLESCRTGNYTNGECIASTYVLSRGPGSEPNRGLTALAPSWDSSGWAYLYRFFAPFSEGKSWGEAVKNYFTNVVSAYDAEFHYHLYNLLGDPMLKRSDYMEDIWQGRNVPEWVRRYDGPSNGDDRAKDIWVRGNGVTFTTGYSYDTTGGYDILTQKRDANGELLWEARWNNANNRDDYAMAVAQTPDNGVFVVGATDNATQGLNWRILKYSNSGVFKWNSAYNGPANKDDMAEDVAVDSSNNIFVAGWSTNADDTINLVLRKYASTSSTPLWTKRYTLSAHLSSFVSKNVHVQVDSAGNAYIAGNLNYCLGCPFLDYFLAKYDTYGNLLWQLVYDASGGEDELRGLAVDSAGYAYVTGRSTLEGGVQKMCTIKYDPQGNEAWRRCFANDWTFGDAIAVDTSGNVFVSGDSMAGCHTVKYSADGNELWSRTYGSSLTTPKCITADGDGNVVVAGEQGTTIVDYFVIRYDGNGNLQWWSNYNAPGNLYGEATAIGVDNSNNVYVTGYSSLGTYPDFATLKYQP